MNNQTPHVQEKGPFLSLPSTGCVPLSLGMCNRIGSSGMVAGGGHTLVQKFSGALSDVKSISPARGLVVCWWTLAYTSLLVKQLLVYIPKDENYTLYQGFIQIYSWGGRGEGVGFHTGFPGRGARDVDACKGCMMHVSVHPLGFCNF